MGQGGRNKPCKETNKTKVEVKGLDCSSNIKLNADYDVFYVGRVEVPISNAALGEFSRI